MLLSPAPSRRMGAFVGAAFAALLAAGFAGCGDEEPGGEDPGGEEAVDVVADAGADAGLAADAGGEDGAAADSGPHDTGTDDTGTDDTGTDDTGTDDAGLVTDDVTPGCQSALDCPAVAGPCKVPACDEGTGHCVEAPLPDGLACVGADPCIVNAACAAGACLGGKDVCACKTDADCAPQEDGDACNGKLYCRKTGFPYTCKVNPATVVKCPAADPGPCAKMACQPSSGACTLAAAPTGTLCDDNNACTAGDRCVDGACKAASDICVCTATKDCAAQEDGDACNGVLYCDVGSGACKLNPATVVSCPTVADTACIKNVCQPAAGSCQPTPVELTKKVCVGSGKDTDCGWRLLGPKDKASPAACDDGDPCTQGEICHKGVCGSGTDTCACATTADCAKFDDGNQCNGVLFCNKQTTQCQLNSASRVICPTVNDSDCLRAACLPQLGTCTDLPAGLVLTVCDGPGKDGAPCRTEAKPTGAPEDQKLPCNDGDPCTTGDVCSAGGCVPGTDTCVCKTDKDCVAQDDGDLCNGVMYCNQHTHKCAHNPASVVVCNKDHGDVCLRDMCNPAAGKCGAAPVTDGKGCDDGTLCTAGDACAAGLCTGVTVDCDDGNLCSNDSCTPAKGCIHVWTSCDDGNACTADKCDPTDGKCAFDAASLNGKLCNADDNPCTLNDGCAWGVCKIGVPLVCKLPVKTCEQAVCLRVDGKNHKCIVNQAPDGTACDDGVACTVGSACKSGVCSGAGKERFFVRTYAGPSGRGALHGVGAFADGSLLAAGQTWAKSGNSASGHATWLLRTDAGGGVLWSKQFAGPKAHGGVAGRGVAVLKDGSAIVAGATTTAAGDLNGLLMRVDAAGKVHASKQFGEAGVDEELLGVRANKAGNLLLFGTRTKSGERAGWALHLAAGLQHNWVAPLVVASSGHHQLLHDAAWRADGGLVFVGERRWKSGNTRRGLILPVTAAGKASAPILLAANGWLRSVTEVGAGQSAVLVVGGARSCGSGWCGWLSGVDATGAVLWTAPQQSHASIAALWPATANRVLAAGERGPAGKSGAAWLWGADRLGNNQWTRTIASSAPRRALSMVGLGGAGIAVAGEHGSGAGRLGLLVRTDAWGHSSCASAGKCQDKPTGLCDDNKPCTADWCDGNKGCRHATVDNLACDPADTCSGLSTCKSGACRPAKNGRLWRHDENMAGKTVYSDAALMTDGSVVMTGQAATGGGHKAIIRRIGKRGEAVCATTFEAGAGVRTFGVGVWGYGAGPTSAGSAAVVARAKAPAGGGKHRFGAIAYVAAGGCKIVLLDTGGYFQTLRPHGYIAYPDGSRGTIFEHRPKTDQRYIFVARHWASGKKVWDSAGASAGSKGGQPYDFGMSADDTTTGAYLWGPRGTVDSKGETLVFASVNSTGVGHYIGWVARWNKQGSLVHRTWVNIDNKPQLLEGGAGSGSRTIAVGRICPTGNLTVCRALIVVLDAAGNIVLSKSAFDGFAHDAVALVGGGFVFTGSWFTGGRFVPSMVRWSTMPYTPLWSRPYKDLTGIAKTVRAIPGSTDLLVGIDSGWGKRAVVARTDQWFHRGCAEAGQCVAKTVASCKDGNSCNLDYCDASAGCKHVADPGACP